MIPDIKQVEKDLQKFLINKTQTVEQDELSQHGNYEFLGKGDTETTIIAKVSDSILRFNKALVRGTEPDKRKDLKLICVGCGKVRFEREEDLNLEESQTMKFVSENELSTTEVKDRHGVTIKTLGGNEYAFACEFCSHSTTIMIQDID